MIRLILSLLLISFSCIGYAHAGVIEGDVIGMAVADTLSAIAAKFGVDVEISTPLVRDVIINNSESLSMRLEIPGNDPLARRVPVKVSFLTSEGGVARVTTVVAQVRTFGVAAVTVVDIPEKTLLTHEDIEFRRVDVSGMDGYISPESDFADFQTKRRLRAGTILSEQSIEPVPVIRRGEKVTVNVSVGSVTVTVAGVARQDGGKNEMIRVFTEATKKTITCQVIDSGIVVASR